MLKYKSWYLLIPLYLTVDSDDPVRFGGPLLRDFVDLLGRLHSQECYQGLREFLNRLIRHLS